MMYKPLETAVSYFKDLYHGAHNITRKIGNSLMPISGLELAVAGVPNPVLSARTEAPGKMQGYLLAVYGVDNYVMTGRKVVVTRSDGKQIPLDIPRKGNGIDDQYVKNALKNHGIEINNKKAKRIAKMLREG